MWQSLLLGILCIAGVSTVASASASAPVEIWVITDRQHPVKIVPGARLIELDAPTHIEAQLAAQLPSNPAHAATIAAQQLKDGGAPLQRRLAAAYQGIVDAWSLSIEKIPAVVVDRQYVVYGEPNVDRALRRIADFRSTRR